MLTDVLLELCLLEAKTCGNFSSAYLRPIYERKENQIIIFSVNICKTRSPLTSNQFMTEKKPNYNILRRKQWQPVKMTRFGVSLIIQVYLSFAIMTKDLVAKYRWQKKGLG